MSADIFATGAIDVFVLPRFYNDWLHLGTAITSPKVKGVLTYRPVGSDRTDPGPYNQCLCYEQHHLSMILNRTNHRTWNRIKNVGWPIGIGDSLVRTIPAGILMMGETDFQLYLRYSVPNANFAGPDATPNGRVYRSGIIMEYEEDYPDRVQELSLLVQCNPIAYQHALQLYTESPSDLPQITPESP